MLKSSIGLIRYSINLLVFVLFGICISCTEASKTTTIDQGTSNLFSTPVAQGEVQAKIINEASGLTFSRLYPDVVWTHNDSGGDAAIYPMKITGEDLGFIELSGAKNIDWEDIASGPGPDDGQNYLYVGDIGDNRASRTSLTIYRTPEPTIDVSSKNKGIVSAIEIEKIKFKYPDGARDAETLMVDPWTKDIIIVSKRETNVNVYQLPYPQSVSEVNTAIYLHTLPLTGTVAGDISPDGKEFLIKTYDSVYYWSRGEEQSVLEVLRQEPTILKYIPEPQGEAIAWSIDAKAYYTVSEESKNIAPVVYGYVRN